MKKLIALVLLAALCLTSCSLLREEDPTSEPTLPIKGADAAEDTSDGVTDKKDTEPPHTAETAEPAESIPELSPLPAFVGLYDDLENNGVYTRLDSWNAPWSAGADIAVFDVIPSSLEVLANPSYRNMWTEAASALDTPPKPYLILDYTLDDGTSLSCEIKSPADAEAVISEGYLEVYLYDDVHQPDGAWYSHLTEHDVTADTVISSVKLTAGVSIARVTAIKLTACLDGSAPASVVLTNG